MRCQGDPPFLEAARPDSEKTIHSLGWSYTTLECLTAGASPQVTPRPKAPAIAAPAPGSTSCRSRA